MATAPNLNLSECTTTFTTEKHYEYPERLNHLYGTLTHPTLGELGTVTALQITRRMYFKDAGDFLEIMDEDSQELHEFSTGLFDKNSNIRPWLVDGGSRSGSGCWGSELSVGDMLYVQDLSVKAEYKRHGVGSKLLQALLETLDKGFRAHAFAWPTPICFRSDDKAEWIREQDNIIAFYRKNGFRRVGLTQFFAYSPDPAHPSRKLPVSADPEPPWRAFDLANATTPKLTIGEVKTRFPVHYAITTNKTASLAATLVAAHGTDAGILRARDAEGMTPVFIAAASENLLALRVLLDLDPQGVAEDLINAQNAQGMTPLEALQSSMRSTREFSETLLGKWDGYPDAGLQCEYVLAKAMRLPLVLDGEGNPVKAGMYVKKRKYGCTCGKCTGGWMSPRMRFCLATQAALQKDNMSFEIDYFKPRQPRSPSSLLCCGLDYIPPPIRREVYKSFYLGLYTVFLAIYDILERPGSVLTPKAVLAEALTLDAGCVQFFLNKGGRMEHVLDATVHMAREQSSLGDGTFEETFDVDPDADSEGEGGDCVREFRAMPRCANDLAFEVVRSHVGLSAGVQWGPYQERQDEDGMDVDEDSDSD
ncbi:hypothetical protein GALMADRAFT_259860 [Galerina marginata CBS 339.88]|uniref:N-acetyltransferase domain-containing protein n=1 Tax=Galerina marginata (strain CBS 339.88) TaxID=685588 RepID=A0A067SH09_GALM3|nr:hypothetical protein GALMADRAFT_259860 [Galerina marginata CBS 339.88]